METNSSQKVSCVVNYTYDASEADELTIRPGDVLKDIERLPGGWWRGELRGRRGMFPDNFVTVLQEHATNRTNAVQGRCRAVFSYLPANPDELPLCVGDVLEVLGEVEEGWWQGRRAGRVGVFPSNFVVMLDPPNATQQPAPAEPAPALPPKPVKEQCRVLFPYTAVNEDELTLADGDIVTIVSKDAPDRGWWRGEVNGRVGLFPDNFVQLLPAVAQDVEEKKPDRPPSKGSNSIYPVLNKYSEKISSVKELTTTKLSMHKENTVSKESSTQSTVTHTSKSDSEKIIHSESVTDGPEGQVKKPPVPVKKSPTPTSAVTGLFSGLKNKMLSSSDKSEKTSTSISNSSNSSVEGDKTDGVSSSKVANTSTFDHVERNSILNDPRASRVKAPRRRPPSQIMRDDSPVSLGLTNGHEASPDKTLDKSSDRSSDKSLDISSEIKPRAREWEKHRAPWMAELKLNQAKKGGLGDRKQHTSTDRIVDCGVEEKRSSHSMEMSKSTSSISSRISVMESSECSFEKIRTTDKKESPPPDLPTTKPPPLTSPTAAGRTLTTMLDDIKKPPTPSPPLASARLDLDKSVDKSLDGSLDRSDKSLDKSDKVELREKSELKTERLETISRFSSVFNEVEEKGISFSSSILSSSGISPNAERTSTLERRHTRTQDHEGNDALIAQLNSRISNLEKLIEVQNAKFTAAIEELTNKLTLETEKRQTLQTEMEKLAQCVTQV
ncbi:SH3 domain-containing kinase-binding protein 1 isoform X1 [Pieris rapae]|uniref:SH3 domain-containing kinase-binding protein 1 isoform X1 n=2 Tax=Pieris rapae TaxID=64459 RepID=UPI001E27BF40|nr:SH3 domain-containing kinase-binding protein 1 isoform X1 [Pieris rapae]